MSPVATAYARLLLGGWLLLPGLAWAHATLAAASPPAGATVHTPPEQLVLTFSERVEARFCRVEVLKADGEAAVAGSWYVDPKDHARLIVPVIRLTPGVYSVAWRAVSVDTHRTEGRYQFSVAP